MGRWMGSSRGPNKGEKYNIILRIARGPNKGKKYNIILRITRVRTQIYFNNYRYLNINYAL